jgi:hypothetical protein
MNNIETIKGITGEWRTVTMTNPSNYYRTNKDGKPEHFFPLPDKPKRKVALRPSKHERLLKALLSSPYVMDAIKSSVTCEVSEGDYKQLIAIKQRMEQKGTNE